MQLVRPDGLHRAEYHTPRVKAASAAIFCGISAACALYYSDVFATSFRMATTTKWLMLALAVLMACILVHALVQVIIPNRLQLTDGGLTYQTAFRPSRYQAWDSVSHFEIYEIKHVRIIRCHLKATSKDEGESFEIAGDWGVDEDCIISSLKAFHSRTEPHVPDIARTELQIRSPEGAAAGVGYCFIILAITGLVTTMAMFGGRRRYGGEPVLQFTDISPSQMGAMIWIWAVCLVLAGVGLICLKVGKRK